MEQVELPENYRLSFNAMIHLIEEKLVEMEMYFITYQLASRVSVHWEDDLSPEEKDAVQKHIKEIYGELQAFFERYRLDERRHSLRRQLNVSASFIWEDLENCRARQMRGHGTIDPSILKDLDAFIDLLVDSINHIAAVGR